MAKFEEEIARSAEEAERSRLSEDVPLEPLDVLDDAFIAFLLSP